MRASLTIAAIALAGCATHLQVSGPYASQLSQADIEQITALIIPSPDISDLCTRLEAVRPGEVRVKYGGYYRSHGVYTADPADEYFTAYKRHGRWVAGSESGIEGTITVY